MPIENINSRKDIHVATVTYYEDKRTNLPQLELVQDQPIARSGKSNAHQQMLEYPSVIKELPGELEGVQA